jgi:steroid delta-isomerase-like uncharacterized protein
MSTENEALVRRFFEELYNARNVDVADEIIAADFVNHVPQNPSAEGPEGIKATVAAYEERLDAHWDIQEMHSTGDRVFVRWIGSGTHVGELNGIAPTGATISIEALAMFRIADGKIAEEWTVYDALGLLQQIGALPASA